jgi:hypothetical protein
MGRIEISVKCNAEREDTGYDWCKRRLRELFFGG